MKTLHSFYLTEDAMLPKRFYTIVARGQHGAYSLQVQRATSKNALRYAQILFPSRDGFWDWEAIECRCGNNEDLCEACVYAELKVCLQRNETKQ